MQASTVNPWVAGRRRIVARRRKVSSVILTGRWWGKPGMWLLVIEAIRVGVGEVCAERGVRGRASSWGR